MSSLFGLWKWMVGRWSFFVGQKTYVRGRFGNIGDELITHTPIGIVVTRDQLNGMTQKLCWSCCYCCCDSSDFCGKWARHSFSIPNDKKLCNQLHSLKPAARAPLAPKGNKRQTNHPLLGVFAISFRVISLVNRVVTPVTPIYFGHL